MNPQHENLMDQSTDAHVVLKQPMKWKEHGRMNSETSGNPRNGYLDLHFRSGELGKVQKKVLLRDKEILKSSDLSEGIPLKEPCFWILIFHFFTSSLWTFPNGAIS